MTNRASVEQGKQSHWKARERRWERAEEIGNTKKARNLAPSSRLEAGVVIPWFPGALRGRVPGGGRCEGPWEPAHLQGAPWPYVRPLPWQGERKNRAPSLLLLLRQPSRPARSVPPGPPPGAAAVRARGRGRGRAGGASARQPSPLPLRPPTPTAPETPPPGRAAPPLPRQPSFPGSEPNPAGMQPGHMRCGGGGGRASPPAPQKRPGAILP